MSSESIYFVYRTTNLINGKIYVGVHKTKNMNDGYMGSGVQIQRSIKKYGKENFHREILCFTETYSEAFEIEELIVDQEFLDSPSTYNMKLGGSGGFTLEEQKTGGISTFQRGVGLFDPILKETVMPEVCRQNGLRTKERRIGIFDPSKIKFYQYLASTAAMSKEARDKRNSTYTEIRHQQGERNSQHNTVWIMNPSTNENRKIKSTDELPKGFYLGRYDPNHAKKSWKAYIKKETRIISRSVTKERHEFLHSAFMEFGYQYVVEHLKYQHPLENLMQAFERYIVGFSRPTRRRRRS